MNDKYLQYQIDELVGDDQFIDWVISGINDSRWQVWLSENPDKSNTVLEARKLISGLQFKEIPIEQGVKDQLWKKIKDHTSAREIPIGRIRKKWIYGLAIAASLALLFMVIFQDNGVVHKTDLASTELITLPAASQVELAAKSEITYTQSNWAVDRQVQLKGQGHFKVSKGVPFTVNTSNGTVQVLGTEFDVVSIKDAFQVNVSEGKVSVSSGNHVRILTAGMAFYRNPQWSGEHSLNESWRTNNMYFVFRNQPLADVLRAISFAYDVTFDTADVDTAVSFTGTLGTTNNLQSSLESILWVLNIDYSIVETTVTLSPR